VKRSHKYFRRILIVLAGAALLYAFLLIPGNDASLSSIGSDRVEKNPLLGIRMITGILWKQSTGMLRNPDVRIAKGSLRHD
jgi:hypothetical protein